MSKRKKVFELINHHVENHQVQEIVTEYISNLHLKINELNESLEKKKKRTNIRRTKRMATKGKD